MATSLCPGQFFFACDTQDLFIMVGLIIIVVILIVFFGIFLYLRGDFGALFYHSDKLQIGLQFENEGKITGFVLKDFGALKMINSGPDKGGYIIPRMNSTFKSPRSPAIIPILGRGKGLAVNPFIAEYVRRMGGRWPDWSGAPPPGKPRDLRQWYQMYTDWKAGGEAKSGDSRQKYVLMRMAETDVPGVLQGDDLKEWTQGKKTEFEEEYDKGAWGPFTVMASKLRSPDLPDAERLGIYQALNSAIQSEPSELWPTWICGQMIDSRDLAKFAEFLDAAEVESAMNRVQRALKSDANSLLVKVAIVVLLFFGIAVSFAIVYTVLHP